MRKSDSSSPRPTRERPDYLTRKPHYREFQPEDEKYFWAAYQKGALDIEPGMNKQQFHETLAAARDAADWFTLFAGTSRGNIPVGAIRAMIGERMMEPHVVWFPWASPRNKLESIANFLNESGRVWLVLVITRFAERAMYARLCEAGYLRHCGSIKGYYPDDDAAIYQTVDK